MTYGITWVPYGRITGALPQIMPFLTKSEYWTNGKVDVDDIVKNLYSGQDLLWVVYEEATEKVVAFVITEIKQYPQKKVLSLKYIAGETGVLSATEDVMQTTLERFARDTQCDGMEAIGRFGWKHQIKKYGYTPYMVMYEKSFD